MKKKIRNLLIVLAACAVSAFAFIGSSCDTIEEQLKQATCEHVLVDGKVTKEATCTETGEKLLECTSCTYTEKKELPKLAHTELVMKAVSPTCTTSGKTEGKKCAVCNEILVRQNVVPATGHKAVLDEAIEATCTAPGKTEGSHCEKCDTVFEAQETIPVKEHVLVNVGAYAATCEEKGFTGGTKCQNCDYATDGEVIPALGHSYDDGQITTEATCTNDGVKTFTCATCEDTYTEVISALGHNYDDGQITTEATCTNDGVKTFTCATCEDTYTETLAAVGHSYSNGTCSVCGQAQVLPGNGATIEFIFINEDGTLDYDGLSGYLWNMEVSLGRKLTYNGEYLFPSIQGYTNLAAYDAAFTTYSVKVYESGTLNITCGAAAGALYTMTDYPDEITLGENENLKIFITQASYSGGDREKGGDTIQINYVGTGEVEKAETFTFTIEGATYQAEEGMTWGEWVGSVYDNNSEYNNNVGFIHYKDKNAFIHINEDMVYETDIIVAGTDYRFLSVNGPLPT